MNDGSDPDFSTTSASGASGASDPTDLGASGASGPLAGDAPAAATGLNGPSGPSGVAAADDDDLDLDTYDPVATPAPKLAAAVHDNGDGTVTVNGLQSDGVEHTITLAENHGALLAFKTAIEDWFQRLGERATAWEKTEPKPVEPPA